MASATTGEIREDLESAYRTASATIGANGLQQTPQVDANGNGIPNQDGDLRELRDRFLGNGTEYSQTGPVISEVSAGPR